MPAWTTTALLIAQGVTSLLIIVLILIQSRGSGVSAVFGGGEGNVYRTRRGAEKVIFQITVILIVLWFIIAGANLFFHQ